MRHLGTFGLAFLLLLGGFSGLSAQAYWVFFEDKGPEKDWYVSHPDHLLSPQGLQRRQQRGIPLDERDVPVSTTYLAQLRAANIEIRHTSKWLNAASIVSDLSLAELRAICPAVRDMRPLGRFVRHQVPTDATPTPTPPPTTFDYGATQNQIEMLNVDCLHERGFAGKDILVAIFDSGFLNMDTITAFDSLWLNNRVKGVYDFVDKDTLVFEEDGHGTMVTSCFAGNDPGVYVGSGPRVDVLLARTETVFEEVHQEEDNWMAAVEWADSLGADIIQNSLGYSRFDPGEGDYTYADMDGNTTIISRAADIAASKGILVVTSAGNEGNGNWHYIIAPCDADSVLCVGAVTSFQFRSSFSSVGPSSDGQIKPDVMALGSGARVINPFNGGVANQSGTSFATPLVTGLVASLMEAHPLRSNMEVIQAVRESGDRAMSPDTAYGYGIPDACVADSILAEMDSLATNADIQLNPDKYFNFYPNPVQDQLVIEVQSLTSPVERVSMYAVDGTLISSFAPQEDDDRWILETSHLSPGIYLLKLHLFGNPFVSHRFVKQ